MRISTAPALIVSLFVVACTGGGDSDSGKGADPGTTGTGGTTGTQTDVETVTLSSTFLEFATGAPIAGATVTYEDQTVTTNAGGSASLELPASTNVELIFTAEGFRETHVFHPVASVDVSLSSLLPSEATAAALTGALGVTLDPAKAIVAVGVYQLGATEDDFSDLEGATVDLDVGYDAAVVPDASSRLGISIGNTTLPNSRSTVVFLNAESGTITPAITPPGGVTCARGADRYTAGPGTYAHDVHFCQ